MKTALLAGIAVLLLVTGTAHAGPRPQVIPGKPRIITRIITVLLSPPPKYDKPYEGELEIVFFSNKDDLEGACKELRPGVHACARRTLDNKKCRIFASSEEFMKRKGRNYPFMLRHELAHCNGWKHPEDTNGRKFNVGDNWDEAEGAKWVVASTKASMPNLPASTKILPAFPPVVCVTPEWKQEPCAKRLEGAWAYSRSFPTERVETTCPKVGEVYEVAKVPPHCLVRR